MILRGTYIATAPIPTASKGMFQTPPDPHTTGVVCFVGPELDCASWEGKTVYFKTDRTPIREGGVEYFVMDIENVLGIAE